MQAHRSLDSKLTPYRPHYLNSTNAIGKSLPWIFSLYWTHFLHSGFRRIF